MRYFRFSLWRSAVLPAFLLSLLFLPSTALAVVGDVTLTGLPPNTTVSLTNEETKEKVEQKTDDRGFVVIPITGKNWQSGRHSVTCQVDGKPVTSRIFLRDGANRIDLTALTYSARPLDSAKAQRVDEALKKSSAAIKADPSNHQARLTQGAALNRLGRHGEALAQLARAVKMGSTHPALAFETGWSLMRLGMYPEAIAQLEKYEKMKPGLGQTSEFIGRSHLFMNELDKADAKFKEALGRDPKLASTVRFHQAVLETLRKNPQAASNHIGALLKEAPNSPTAQIFKNATLQAPGAKPPTGSGAKDYRLSDPIKIQLPPTTAADVAGSVAKGVVGGLLGGLFGGGGRPAEPEGPDLVAKPSYPETMLTSKDGKTKINLSGALVDGKPNIVMGVQQSPGNGAPHLIMLQDKNCNILQPAETSVTAIWEQWGAWKLTVSWTKSYYQDGKLVKQEKGGWSTPWNEFRTQIKDPSEIPGIWKDFGDKPFGATREVLSTFEPPPGVPFIPADWNLITHTTTDAGNNQILTAPFVTGLGTDQNNNLIFQQQDRTACEFNRFSDAFWANATTVPLSGLGLDGLFIYGQRQLSSGLLDTTIGEQGFGLQFTARLPLGPVSTWWHAWYTTGDEQRISGTRPGTTATTETRPGGSKIVTRKHPSYGPVPVEIRPDGTEITTFPDGYTLAQRGDDKNRTYVQTSPDGTVVTTVVIDNHEVSRSEVRPDGHRITEDRRTRTKVMTSPDGSSVEVDENGNIKFNDPPQPTQSAQGPAAEPDVPGLNDPPPAEGPPAVFTPDGDNAPVDQVM